MLIKASQRGGARNLANHLASTRDNDHVTLTEVRGLCGHSLHAALLEIEAVSYGTNCQQPLFSVSFNPPPTEDVSQAAFNGAFDKLEHKMGLEGQARVVVYHEKEGRKHAHVVWSRIDVDEMKSIRMSHFKTKCKEVSRDLYLQHDWDMPDGYQKDRQRDPFDLTNAEWQQCKRQGVKPKEIKANCQDAWARSDGIIGFKQALEEKGLFLAQGDKRGFVVMDANAKVYSLTRYGGISRKDLAARLGEPNQLPTVSQTSSRIRSLYNSQALEKVRALKHKHEQAISQLVAQKDKLVAKQREERKSLWKDQRRKRDETIKKGRDRFRRGVRGFFDKVSGRNKRFRLINQKEIGLLDKRQQDARERQVFKHNAERRQLQVKIQQQRDIEMKECAKMAERLVWLKKNQDRETQRTQERSKPSRTREGFDKARRGAENTKSDKPQSRGKGRDRSPS